MRTANRQLRALIKETELGTHVKPTRLTLADFLTTQWLPAHRIAVRPTTYHSAVDYIDRYIKHLLQVNPVFFTELLKSAQESTAEDILPEIKVPTLIIAGEQDQFTPLWISKKMHRLIPDSELMIIKNGTHAALIEQPELVNLRIEKFIKERLPEKK